MDVHTNDTYYYSSDTATQLASCGKKKNKTKAERRSKYRRQVDDGHLESQVRAQVQDQKLDEEVATQQKEYESETGGDSGRDDVNSNLKANKPRKKSFRHRFIKKVKKMVSTSARQNKNRTFRDRPSRTQSQLLEFHEKQDQYRVRHRQQNLRSSKKKRGSVRLLKSRERQNSLYYTLPPSNEIQGILRKKNVDDDQSDKQQRKNKNVKFSQQTNLPNEMKNNKSSIQRKYKIVKRFYSNEAKFCLDRDGNKFFRVKPHHIFPNARQVLLSEERLSKEMKRKSNHFQFCNSYSQPVTDDESMISLSRDSALDAIGGLNAEVLRCVGLTKHHRFRKPNTVVYMSIGDCAFASDIITQCKSPIWHPMSKRACRFPIFHAYTRLHVGVFDASTPDNIAANAQNDKKKESRSHQRNDKFLGKVTIDLCSLRPDTEYTITLPLRYSNTVYDRRPRGLIRLRLSLHWKNESAAVMSYMSEIKNKLYYGFRSSSLLKESSQLSIPCSDPKTLRNLALTIYGHDLPGMYSNRTFKALLREISLYELCVKVSIKAHIKDIVFWRNPITSFYLFSGWMLSVKRNTLSYMPAIFSGFFVILMIHNYIYFFYSSFYSSSLWQRSKKRVKNLAYDGYYPPSLREIIFSFLFGCFGFNNKDEENVSFGYVKPLLLWKQDEFSSYGDVDESRKTLGYRSQPGNHMEFPFSTQEDYPKMKLTDSTSRLHSSSETPLPPQNIPRSLPEGLRNKLSQRHIDITPQSQLYEEEDDGSEKSQTEYVSDYESDEDNDNDFYDIKAEFPISQREQEEKIDDSNRKPPLQDHDCVEAGKPISENLERIEFQVHKYTRNMFEDNIFQYIRNPKSHEIKDQYTQEYSSKSISSSTSKNLKTIEKEGEDMIDMEYSKKLGLISSNPMTKLTNSHLGPVMRILNVVVVFIRSIMSIMTWRDHYLSFWVLIILVILTLILLIIPWRLVLFVCGFITLGPQNFVLIRLYERAKRNKKKRGNQENVSQRKKIPNSAIPAKDSSKKNLSHRTNFSDKSSSKSSNISASKEHKCQSPTKRRGMLGNKSNCNESSDQNSFSSLPSIKYQEPFCGVMQLNQFKKSDSYSNATLQQDNSDTRPSDEKITPRELRVPYHIIKRERFYDWPPNKSVSFAFPVNNYNSCKSKNNKSCLDVLGNKKILRQKEGERLIHANIHVKNIEKLSWNYSQSQLFHEQDKYKSIPMNGRIDNSELNFDIDFEQEDIVDTVGHLEEVVGDRNAYRTYKATMAEF